MGGGSGSSAWRAYFCSQQLCSLLLPLAYLLLQVAEATVLHNEAQLQHTLEGRMLAEGQVHSLRLQLEDGQALLDRLKLKLGQLAAAEQAAAAEAAAVRSALQAAGATGGGSAAGSGSPYSSSLGEEVGAAVGTLVQRIQALEQQVTSQQQQLQDAATAAAQLEQQQQQAAASPPMEAVGVQCEPPAPPAAQTVGVQCEAAVQASAGVQAVEPHDMRASAAQTDAGQPEEDVCYGRADPKQQQVVQLTAQLAAARLAEVGAKAELAGTEARLLEAERQVRGWVVPTQRCVRW
jgi:hypothetical protein